MKPVKRRMSSLGIPIWCWFGLMASDAFDLVRMSTLAGEAAKMRSGLTGSHSSDFDGTELIMGAIKDGKLIDPRVTLKISATIERGALTKVNAIVIHQTGAPTAESTLASYRGKANGAHFLIDKDGTIYQTARVTQKTYHVGKIKSRCLETHLCTKEETTAAKDILFAKGKGYCTRVEELATHERKKEYPKRYPTNSDSIGIELVGETNAQGAYVTPTAMQTGALKFLVSELQTGLGLTASNVFRHPEVSYKQPSEASGAEW